mmetsp:Transcript_22877/g.28433  ORF Transcript_22877/g.28433 Transcript_22877/m.28433 type:complete len:106 (+) Transcript_22877:2960-3277(+)
MKASNTIKNLHEEMDELRTAQRKAQASPQTLAKFIKNDYFYQEVNTIPRVTFVDGGGAADKSSDPAEGFMDQRPSRAAVMGGGKPITRSFITNQKEAALPTQIQR